MSIDIFIQTEAVTPAAECAIKMRLGIRKGKVMTQETLWKEACQLHQSGELKQAKALYEQLLMIEPWHSDALHYLGILSAQAGQFLQAVQWIQQAIAIQPEKAVLYNHLGNALIGLQQLQEAILQFHIALTLNPQYAEAHNNLGRALYKQKDFKAAIAHYSQALHYRPYYEEAQLNLGLVLIAAGETRAANEQFQAVLQRNPQSLLAREQLAQLDFQAEDWHSSHQNYEYLLQRQPKNLEVLNNLGAILSKTGQYRQAIQYFEQVLAINPQYSNSRSNLAALYLQQHQLKEAVWHYRLYLGLNPKDSEAHYNLGVSLMLSGYLPEAISAFQKTLSLNTQCIDAWCNLGAIYLRQSDKTRAYEAYQQVLLLQAKHPIASYMMSALGQFSSPPAAPLEYIKNLFDSYAPQFDHHLTRILHYQMPILLRQLVDPYLNNTTLPILDLGCGTGLSGIAFREIATRLVGIDISPYMLLEARKKKIYDQLIEGDLLTQLPKLHANYGLVISVDTFVYFGDLQPIFQQINRCLRPPACFAFSVESGDTHPYQLQSTGRYQHARDAVIQYALEAGFTLILEKLTYGREQSSLKVSTRLFLLRKTTT